MLFSNNVNIEDTLDVLPMVVGEKIMVLSVS